MSKRGDSYLRMNAYGMATVLHIGSYRIIVPDDHCLLELVRARDRAVVTCASMPPEVLAVELRKKSVAFTGVHAR